MTAERPARPLLTVKYAIPPVRAGAVPRPRLVDALRAGSTRLTVVVAPAGWGKTSLLSAWAADPARRGRVAWVSLDEGDDEPVRFWSYVLTALQRRRRRDQHAPRSTRSRRPGLDPVDLALPMLLNELAARRSTPHVLVLDDYHVLADPRIHESVEFLVDLPAGVAAAGAGRPRGPAAAARPAAGAGRADRAAGGRPAVLAPTRRPPCCRRVSGADAGRSAAPRRVGADRGLGGRACSWPGWPRGRAERPPRRASAATTGTCSTTSPPRCCPPSPPSNATSWCGPRRSNACRARSATPRCRSTGSARCSARWTAPTCSWSPWTPSASGTAATACCATCCCASESRRGTDARSCCRAAAVVRRARPDRRRRRASAARRRRRRRGRAAGGVRALVLRSAGPPRASCMLGEQLPDRGRGPQLAISLAYAAATGGRPDRVPHWLDLRRRGSARDTVIDGWHDPRAAALMMRAVIGMLRRRRPRTRSS